MDLPAKRLKLEEYKERAINLLDLPNEILLKIFSYIPDQLKISLTCKKFYEISLKKSYKLSFNVRKEKHHRFGPPADTETVTSILATRRKIHTFSWGSDWDDPQFSNAFAKISECHGENIKNVSIIDRSMKFLSTFLDISAFNFMENLFRLDLTAVNIGEIELPDDFQLKLFNLRELDLVGSESMIPVLNRLPDNVLQKLVLINVQVYRIPGEFWEFFYFSNQKSIEELDISYSDINAIAIDQLRPERLTYTCCGYGEEMDHPEMTMAGQDKLKYFNTNYLGCQLTLNYLCNHMVSLEELELNSEKIPDEEPIQDFSPLEKLKNFKRFKLGVLLDENRLTLRSNSLEEICFDIAADDDEDPYFVEFSANCPNLRKIVWPLAPLRVFNEILPNFPRLESFETKSSMDGYEFEEGVELKNLKHLKVSFIENTEDFLNFFANCKKLESIKAVISEFDGEFLKNLIRVVPSLKSLCLRVKHRSDFDIEDVKDIVKILDNFDCFFEFDEKSMKEIKEMYPSCKLEINPKFTILHFVKDGCENICCTGNDEHLYYQIFDELN